MKKIMFVCHGNICRSTMAEFVMKDLVNKYKKYSSYYIESSATSNEAIGMDTHIETKKILKNYNINFYPRKAKRITLRDYNDFDFIICMDSNNISNLKKIIPNDYLNKVSKLLDYTDLKTDIADPWYTHDFEKTFHEVILGCIGLFNYIEGMKNE